MVLQISPIINHDRAHSPVIHDKLHVENNIAFKVSLASWADVYWKPGEMG
jgi:hypothetical protein